MSNINENFEVKTGLQVGATTIIAATGDITGGGNLTIGNTIVSSGGSILSVGGTVINGQTGTITTSGNITSTSGSIIMGNTVITGGGTSSFDSVAVTGGTINGTTIGSSTPSAAHFTTVSTTGITTVSADILPTTNSTINIGSATNRFKAIYVDEAHLSTNTLYLGDTPILGTTNNVINIHADPGQAISMQTSGAAGNLTFVSNAQVTMQTTGNNADVLIQSNGTGSKTRLLSASTLELTAPTSAFTSNVTFTGNQTVNGGLLVQGNLTVTGTTTAVNTTDLNVQDNIVILNYGETGLGVTAGSAGLQFARGQLGSYQLLFRESDQSLRFGAIGSTNEVAVKNGAGQIVGNISGSAATATTAATVTSAAQPTITSVGTLTGLTVSGNTTLGNATIDGNLIVNGTTTTVNATTLDVADINITVAKNAATAIAANGAGLTVNGPTVPATLLYASADDSWNLNKKVSATSFYGSGAGLTSVPNSALTNNSVTVTAGTGMSGGGAVALGGSVTLTNAGVTEVSAAGGITVSGSTGSVTISSTATSNNTLSAIVARDASGNFSAGTITASLTGTASNATTLANLTPSNGAGVANRIVAADANGYINNNYFSSTDGAVTTGVTAVMVKAGSNTLRSGDAASVIEFLGLANAATTTATSLNTPSTIVLRDASGSFSANVVTAISTSAQYADLAENYSSDYDYAPGTVVSFGGSAEVTLSLDDGDAAVAGVVSTNPAYLMNSELAGTKVAVALQGRVPVLVVGPVRKGQMLVSAGTGYARAELNPKIGSVIGKALQDFDGENGVIEVVVGRV